MLVRWGLPEYSVLPLSRSSFNNSHVEHIFCQHLTNFFDGEVENATPANLTKSKKTKRNGTRRDERKQDETINYETRNGNDIR